MSQLAMSQEKEKARQGEIVDPADQAALLLELKAYSASRLSMED